MRIRTITAFVALPAAKLNEARQVWEPLLQKGLDVIAQAKHLLETAGYEVQTARIATNPFPEFTTNHTVKEACILLDQICSDRGKFQSYCMIDHRDRLKTPLYTRHNDVECWTSFRFTNDPAHPRPDLGTVSSSHAYSCFFANIDAVNCQSTKHLSASSSIPIQDNGIINRRVQSRVPWQ